MGSLYLTFRTPSFVLLPLPCRRWISQIKPEGSFRNISHHPTARETTHLWAKQAERESESERDPSPVAPPRPHARRGIRKPSLPPVSCVLHRGGGDDGFGSQALRARRRSSLSLSVYLAPCFLLLLVTVWVFFSFFLFVKSLIAWLESFFSLLFLAGSCIV